MLLNVLIELPDKNAANWQSAPQARVLWPAAGAGEEAEALALAEEARERSPELARGVEKFARQFAAVAAENRGLRQQLSEQQKSVAAYRERAEQVEAQLAKFARGEKFFSEKYVEKIIVDPNMKADLAGALAAIERYKEKVQALQLQLEQLKLSEKVVERVVVDPNMKADLANALAAIEKYKAKLAAVKRSGKTTTVSEESAAQSQFQQAQAQAQSLQAELAAVRQKLQRAERQLHSFDELRRSAKLLRAEALAMRDWAEAVSGAAQPDVAAAGPAEESVSAHAALLNALVQRIADDREAISRLTAARKSELSSSQLARQLDELRRLAKAARAEAAAMRDLVEKTTGRSQADLPSSVVREESVGGILLTVFPLVERIGADRSALAALLREQAEQLSSAKKPAKPAGLSDYVDALNKARTAAGTVAALVRDSGGEPEVLKGVNPSTPDEFVRDIAAAFVNHEANAARLRELLKEKLREISALRSAGRERAKAKPGELEELADLMERNRQLSARIAEAVERAAPEPRLQLTEATSREEVIELTLTYIESSHRNLKLLLNSREELASKVDVFLAAGKKTNDEEVERLRRLQAATIELNREVHLVVRELSPETAREFSADPGDNPRTIAESALAYTKNSGDLVRLLGGLGRERQAEAEALRRRVEAVKQSLASAEVEDLISVLNNAAKTRALLKDVLAKNQLATEEDAALPPDSKKTAADYMALVRNTLKQADKYTGELSDYIQRLKQSQAKAAELEKEVAAKRSLKYGDKEVDGLVSALKEAADRSRALERLFGGERPAVDVRGKDPATAAAVLGRDGQASAEVVARNIQGLLEARQREEGNREALAAALQESVSLRKELHRLLEKASGKSSPDQFDFNLGGDPASLVADLRLNVSAMGKKVALMSGMEQRPQGVDSARLLPVLAAVEELKATINDYFESNYDEINDKYVVEFGAATPSDKLIEFIAGDLSYIDNLWEELVNQTGQRFGRLHKSIDELKKVNDTLSTLNDELKKDLNKRVVTVGKLQVKLFSLLMLLQQEKDAATAG